MKEKILDFKVPSSFDEKRIDKFLQSQIKELSRTKLQALIENGEVKLNNVIITNASKKIKEQDVININFPLAKEIHIKPNKIPLDILFEDSDVIVINKSSGVVVHPGAGNYENTVVNGLLYKYKNNLSNLGGKFRPGIVHRIDKDTSGVIVVARNDFSHAFLSEQFSKHTIKRFYEALVWGSIKPQSGKIKEKIGRSEKNRQLMSVKKDKGKIAITNYKTVKIFQNFNLPKISLIECVLETGRTHQIRVHMNFKGNPILGDRSYGKVKKKYKKIDLNVEKEINSFSRQALHAKSLGFIHPRTGKELFFEAKRPKDFEVLIKCLNKASL
ncbi:RluA family pseudouridine synthase [Pelagibacteraceae bacterium]|jgi:23S rRNA pseudouridine1911/1915/1917 synthase|nr:RluA family pseudouridine synthase [Pelagibacteraceae bacterium]